MANSRPDTVFRIHVMGPSGAGKSHLIQHLPPAMLGFDLDYVGFRRVQTNWREWFIPSGVFAMLRDAGRRIVTAGADSDADAMALAARAAGFEPLILLPHPTIVARHRELRGDKPEKVSASYSDCTSWATIARRLDIRVLANMGQVMRVINQRATGLAGVTIINPTVQRGA